MKFFVYKLGCPKNDVDADYISARLIAEGHELVAVPEEADSIIVNTCGFIQAAKEESIGELFRLAELKKTSGLKTLYATGCLSQRYGDELLVGIPELDGAFGLGALDAIADAVSHSSHSGKAMRDDARNLTYLTWKDRHVDDALPFAYLKIADGCNRTCAFCAIPAIRGRFRSRSLDSIVTEARFLAGSGKKELILVSQDATLWGRDLHPRANVVELLKALNEIETVKWIRLMYLYPAQVGSDLIEYMASGSKTLPYFDLPLQHINSDILRSMRRSTDRPETERLLHDIRKLAPAATIRVTLIVGYPGETEEQFQELLDFVDEQQFDRLGAFAYSPEEGTVAEQLAGQIPDELKNERLDRLMSLQQEIAFRKNNSLIGQNEDVIIDSVEPDSPAIGRTPGDCPEIDQEVFVTGPHLRVGDICRVRIDGTVGYDLTATRITE
jgi:ribosomal protein S12 methylthiotransferase